MNMPYVDGEKVGQRLRELRGNRTQKEIADALGVSTMAISSYENGKRIPNDTMKIKIAAYFGKGVEEIFFAA